MRNDMAKVIVERPRRGWDGGHRKPKEELDSLPTKEGMRRGIIREKSLNENLSPLRRFLISQVGRPWNKVYAEICVHLRPTNVVQRHVRSHLEDFVVLKLSVNKDGELEQPHGWRWRWGRQPLYVDPRDGILKRTVSEKEWRRRALQRRQEFVLKKANADKVVVGAMEELLRIDGVWYAVEYAPLPLPHSYLSVGSNGERSAETVNPSYYDVVLRAYVGLMEGYSARGRYAVKKRQLASEELRRYGLCNVIR
jgi:hypothetical protein